jgi:hypothetical protein
MQGCNESYSLPNEQRHQDSGENSRTGLLIGIQRYTKAVIRDHQVQSSTISRVQKVATERIMKKKRQTTVAL